MKNSILTLLFIFLTISIFAQTRTRTTTTTTSSSESTDFVRKGRILLETGYNLFGGLPVGGGTGITILTDGDSNASGLGFTGGYFVAENFALKFNYSNLSSGGASISSYGVGGKYYVGGRVPLDLNLGLLSAGNGFGGSNSDFYSTVTAGYAIPLAQNINLEPSLGLFLDGNEATVLFSLNFAMFL